MHKKENLFIISIMTEKPEQDSPERLQALRDELKQKKLDGFLVPRTDEYQGEYVPAGAERLAWLTGFTGSAGLAVILDNKAAVITDGRYDIQVEQQTESGLYETYSEDMTAEDWLADNGVSGMTIGYDPKLHTPSQLVALKKKLKAKNITLTPVDENPLDSVWDNQPAPPMAMVELFPDSIAGRSAQEKRTDIAKALKNENGKAVILTKSDSIAWLLNVRGNDVPHIPVVLSYAILYETGDVHWFVDSAKVPPDVTKHLGSHVQCREPGELENALAYLAHDALKDNKPVMLDFKRTASWFKIKLEDAGAAVENMADPCILPRACKTPEEQAGIIESHIRDGVAMARFLKWLDEEGPKGQLSEIDVEEQLLQYRQQDGDLRDTSFDTIAGWAGNGAIIHYRATPESVKTITPPGLLLLDSGGQYGSGGTTDITRTIAMGTPTEEMQENFTRVLQGHIGVAMARFPEGTVGAQIDLLARQPLWNAGLDYDHGTGHGVGCYLAVHEEAAGISKVGQTPFAPGMLISNEPGYYDKEDEYGIRIESLVLVREDGLRHGTNKIMMTFETVTMAPIDTRLIKPDMMKDEELAWLNDYHERVYKTLSPRLEPHEHDVKTWLKQACEPLKKNLAPAPGQKKKKDTGLNPGYS